MSRVPSWLVRELREELAPISVDGKDCVDIDSRGINGHVSACEFADGLPRPSEFGRSTVVVHDGWAVWELPSPRIVTRRWGRLLDASLKIGTVRTHGMLHSPKQGASASVFVNDHRVDEVRLVKPHPHGEDFGIDSRRPIPVADYLDPRRSVQVVRVVVDGDAFWDIDRVSLETVVIGREMTIGSSMVIGAGISALLGALVAYLVH